MVDEEGATTAAPAHPRRAAGARPALWKLAIGRLMGWTPEQGRAVEADVRAVAARVRQEPREVARDVAAMAREDLGKLLGEEKRDAG